MDVTLARRVFPVVVLTLLLALAPSARGASQELVGFASGPYAFQTVAFDGLPDFADPGFAPAGWGSGTAPFGFLTTCTGIPAPTQTGGWTNNSDLLLRRSFEAPA